MSKIITVARKAEHRQIFIFGGDAQAFRLADFQEFGNCLQDSANDTEGVTQRFHGRLNPRGGNGVADLPIFQQYVTAPAVDVNKRRIAIYRV